MYQEFLPDRRLAPLVECGWVRSGSSQPLRVMPDGSVDLFVTSRGEVMIAGPATTFYDLHADTDRSFAGLRLRLGAAAAVLGQPVNELSDRQIAIDSGFRLGSHLSAERAFAATTPIGTIAALRQMLLEHLAITEPVVDAAVDRAVWLLRRRPDTPLPGLAAAVGLSERQLRRRFDTTVGFGPKRLGRILRFQRLLDLIRSRTGGLRWAELATEANYSDQPHMIRECRSLSGMSPVAMCVGLPMGVSVSSNTEPPRMP